MDERKAAEALLTSVRRAIKASEVLMESESEEVRIFALDVFTKLAEMEIALLEALGEKAAADEGNPLARRVRLT
jgi:hypothetical protein